MISRINGRGYQVNLQKLPKVKLLKIIKEELSEILAGANEVEEVAAQLMKKGIYKTEEEALAAAESIVFQRNQPQTVDYSQRTGVPSESIPHLKRLGGQLEEGPADITSREGVPAVPRGRAQTQKQSGVERSAAAMLNDLLSRVEELERAEEDTRKLLHQILKSMGVEI